MRISSVAVPPWVRIVVVVALLGLCAWAVRSAYGWAYGNGVDDERAAWVAAQGKADQEARGREVAQTTASEHVADDTRQLAQATGRETQAATVAATETIRYVYRDRLSCPAGEPGPVDAGVLDEFDSAVRAAAAAAR